MLSLFLKASIFSLSRFSKTIPTLISSVSASIQQQPLPSETETLISTAKPLNDSLKEEVRLR